MIRQPGTCFVRIATILGLVLSCANPGPLARESEADPTQVGSPRDEEPRRETGIPIGRSRHPRSGSFSYRVANLVRRGDAVRVDVLFHNGRHRNYDGLMLRVTLVGPTRQQRSTRVPVGPMRDGATRRVSARFAVVPFKARDVRLDLLYSIP